MPNGSGSRLSKQPGKSGLPPSGWPNAPSDGARRADRPGRPPSLTGCSATVLGAVKDARLACAAARWPPAILDRPCAPQRARRRRDEGRPNIDPRPPARVEQRADKEGRRQPNHLRLVLPEAGQVSEAVRLRCRKARHARSVTARSDRDARAGRPRNWRTPMAGQPPAAPELLPGWAESATARRASGQARDHPCKQR